MKNKEVVNEEILKTSTHGKGIVVPDAITAPPQPTEKEEVTNAPISPTQDDTKPNATAEPQNSSLKWAPPG